MRHPIRNLVPITLLAFAAASCAPGSGPTSQTFGLSAPDVELVWAITRDQELPCGGAEMAGGALGGSATFTDLGVMNIDFSAAWDIAAAEADPDLAEFEPEGPAGGPFAPVLGPGEHPYAFEYDPFTDTCDPVVTATGDVTFTADDGDELQGVVTGGETHRLDFAFQGDGIETFATVDFAGGTGRFANADGSFTVHTIARFDATSMAFVIDLVEVLPGGTLTY